MGTIIDDSGKEFFIKRGSMSDYAMLNAEYQGIKEIFETKTIRVPQPICVGSCDGDAYVVFEKLSMGGYGKPEKMAQDLAAMHSCTSPNGMYGWRIDNTIGATFQPNQWTRSWPEFWDEYRLGHMLRLAKREGAIFPKEEELRRKVKSVLEKHECKPSLLHGDLWSGNKAYTKEGDPVIFDPAVYYGDREADIAMTQLFGGLPNAFYDEYEMIMPIPEGYELRKTIYNLYHILNHYVLFGGGYLSQAQGMIDRILSS